MCSRSDDPTTYDEPPMTAGSDAVDEGLRTVSEWDGATRTLRLDGRVVISQTPTDPGDFGEPRVTDANGVTYVSVPEFELWPTDPDWQASDASIVFIEGRSLTMARPGQCVYHLSRRWTYGSVTRCGRIIWTSNPSDRVVTLVPIRRDNASRIGRPCQVCGADDECREPVR